MQRFRQQRKRATVAQRGGERERVGDDAAVRVAAAGELRGLREVARRAAFVSDNQGIVRYVWVGETTSLEPPYQEIAQAVSQL